MWQELDEYVVTRELDKHFRAFISAFLNAADNPGNPEIWGRVGVWVSGFFGSGKSHLIKILSYLLSNQIAEKDGVRRTAVDFLTRVWSILRFATRCFSPTLRGP